MIFSNLNAQTNYADASTQIIRNTALVTYTANNADGVNATFTWTVTGGTIVVGGVDQSSPYVQVGTAAATVSVQVRWANTNTTSANLGTLAVSKTVGALACPSADHTVNVQSWVAPLARVTTTPFDVCSGNTGTVNLGFEGNPGNSGFLYRWRVVRVSDNVVVEDHTAANISSAAATASATIAGITNVTSSPVAYRFEITQMQDGFTDIAAGNITAATVTFNVNPVPVVGPINSSTSLTLR
jgi:hypothetical protein